MRLARFGEPHPVTWSQPAPAGLPPALPVVTSWKMSWYTVLLLPSEYRSGVTKPTGGLPAVMFAWFHTAVIPAHSGAARLVPPTVPWTPPTCTYAPVAGSASAATSGSARPSQVAKLPTPICHDGRPNTSEQPVPEPFHADSET